MEYVFTFELTNPDFGNPNKPKTFNNSPVNRIQGYANTDSGKTIVDNNRAITYTRSMCSMVKTALASISSGMVRDGFEVILVGFTASQENAGVMTFQENTASAPYRTAPPTTIAGKPVVQDLQKIIVQGLRLPAILPVTDQLVYDNLCDVRGEAWFNISVRTPAGVWNANYINNGKPVKVTWQPSYNFRAF